MTTGNKASVHSLIHRFSLLKIHWHAVIYELCCAFCASILGRTEWQMNKSPCQHVSGVCSRWGVKCRLEARSLRLSVLFFRDWTLVIVFAAVRWRAGAGPAVHLETEISDWARAGHLQLQAFGSQTQKHFSYWKDGWIDWVLGWWKEILLHLFSKLNLWLVITAEKFYIYSKSVLRLLLFHIATRKTVQKLYF